MTLFILFVAIVAVLFLFINLVFAPHNPYQEKDSMFECGFHSFQQSRSPFNIAFFIYALVYLLLDLEILLTFPFAVSEYVNNIYGLIITLGFITIITIGFVYELGKGALKIPSKQHTYTIKNKPLIHISYINPKSTKITKLHPFITSPLQSSILPFFVTLKKVRKVFYI
jgi:NADH-ubiquinone oxidoreductase chain 3